MLQYSLLFVLSGLCLAHVIQPVPHQGTIIYNMYTMSSPLGNCSFPPTDVLKMVLSDQEDDQFLFLQKCNVKPHTGDEEMLLCMTLYDIGLKMCSVSSENIPVSDKIKQFLPHNSTEFRKLIVEDIVEDQPKTNNMCQQLKLALEEPTSPQKSMWNLKKTILNSDGACGKLCYDFKDNEKMLCKLILWGSQVLKNSESTVQQDISNPIKLPSMPVVNIGKHSIAASSRATGRTQNKDLADNELSKGVVLAESDVTNHQNTAELGKKTPLSSAADSVDKKQNSESQQQLTQASGIDSQIETGRKPDSQSNSYDTTGLEKSTSHKEDPKKITPSLSGQYQDYSSTRDNVPKSTSNAAKIDLPPQLVISSSSSTVKPIAEGEPGIDDNAPPLSVDGNTDIDGQDINAVPEDDDDQNFNGVGIESPEKPALTGNRNDFKLPQDDGELVTDKFDETEESHFFSYFTTMVLFCIIGYLVFHNKQKILALVLEGRSRRNNRRRPNTANYHKLDCNLEEAVSSPCNTSTTHVIY